MAEFTDIDSTCKNSPLRRPCRAVTLIDHEIPTDAWRTLAVFQGGDEFYTHFSSLFDWAYSPILQSDFSLKLPAVAGPLVLGFSETGTLVFTKEGQLDTGELRARLANPGFLSLPRGPDFSWYSEERGNFKFHDIRSQSQYTVITVYGTGCLSCMDELQHRSGPGELFEYCQNDSPFCQVFAHESYLEPQAGASWADFYRELLEGSERVGKGYLHYDPAIRIPLILNPEPFETPEGYGLRRFYDGYLMALLGKDYYGYWLTVIYDREGTIIATFKASSVTESDPVLAKLQELKAAQPH